MKKMYIKLAAITLTLILSLSIVVMSSYAWFVLSGDPAVSGIQVTIGGGNTILVAPDVVQVVDGQTYHYPGVFSDSMNFAQHKTYDYLKEVGGLVPVSTADGVNWFLPEYYDFTDPEVRASKVLSGELKDYSEFLLDFDLEYANIPAGEKEKIEAGHYVYLDFWVVSPGAGYTLRLSTGDDGGGSFVIDLPEPVAEGESYTLAAKENQAGAAVRVGFLANPVRLTDDSMLHYQKSFAFDERYTSLQGLYKEPGTGSGDLVSNRFTIYEPNADYHPYGSAPYGTYLHTKPVGLVNNEAMPVSVGDRLTVQRKSSWTMAQTGLDISDTAIEQQFKTAIFGKDLTGLDTAAISTMFYGTHLQGQISPYISKGDFITRTGDLYQYSSTVTAEQLKDMDSSGATEDVFIIQLERNVPQRIRMFIWLEGQDADCVNGVGGANIAIDLELAGSNENLE